MEHVSLMLSTIKRMKYRCFVVLSACPFLKRLELVRFLVSCFSSFILLAAVSDIRQISFVNDLCDRYCRDFCDEIILGDAKFTGPNTVTVEGLEINFDKCMVK